MIFCKKQSRAAVHAILFLNLTLYFVWPAWGQKAKNRERKSHGRKAAAQLFLPLAPQRAPVAAAAKPRKVPNHYKKLADIYHRIYRLARTYHQIIVVDTIGYSSTFQIPLLAVKLTDRPYLVEDEPAVLFSGLHHAREPVGTLMCLQILEQLASTYRSDPIATAAIDELAIWVVPVVNPDGYKYLYDNDLTFPWWRKNLRDNDLDGKFDPVIDGVDLNRNYDFNWHEGGERNPASWFYRGAYPFSESEIQALKKLATEQNVFAGLSFHTYGELVLFPWGNYFKPPDQDLILHIAYALASRMKRLSASGVYGVLPLNGRVGQSSVWMYGKLRAIDYIVELGDEHFPDARTTQSIIEQAYRGVRTFLELIMTLGLRGHVLDAATGAPLIAEIFVHGYEDTHVNIRKSEKIYGRYEKVLLPGRYTFTFKALGYEPKTFENIVISAARPRYLDVRLKKRKAFVPMSNH